VTTRIFISLIVLSTATGAAGQPASAAAERLSLDAAIRLAIDNNRQLQAARLQVDKAESEVATARIRRLPAFDTEVSASQLLSPVDFAFPQGAFGVYPGVGPIPFTDTTISVPRQPTYYVSAQVSQPISQLFRLNLGIQSASASLEIQRERARQEQLSLANDVKRLYYTILQTESALAASRSTLELYRELDRTLQVRVAQKVALRSDALDVQFRLAQEELTSTTQLNTLASLKEQLNQLLGRDVRTAFEVEDAAASSVLDIDLDAAHRSALENRPDVREARLKAEQADFDRRIAKADRIPDLSLAVSYTSNFNIDVLPANFATAGLRLTWEPFDWGRKKHELAAKTHAVHQARLGLRDIEDRTVVEINARFRTLTEKRAALNVARLAQNTAVEKLRVKTNQFQVRAALLPDVLQVRKELAESNDRYQQALMDFWKAKADYDLAVGEEGLR
jgi:outer membrane protein TolC